MTAIHHIGMTCRNREAQESFYTRHFGFERARVFNRGEANEFIMLRLGNTCLELFTAGKGNEAETGGEQPVGFRHIAFEVSDLDAVVAGLKGDGIEPDPIRDCSQFVEGMRVCFFNDPDGNRIELAEGYRDE